MGSAAGGNALAALEAQLANAPRARLPFLVDLETMFATDLSAIANATGLRDALIALGARGAASAGAVAFADAAPSLGLVAHEVAHVLQHRDGGDTSDAEAEARRARDHAERGAPGAFAVRANARAPVQLDKGDEPGPAPPMARPPRLESPFAAAIQTDLKTAVPGTARHTLTLASPGEKTTVTIEEQILSAELVTAYAIPLEDTFATPEEAAAARDKDKHALDAPFQIPPAKPSAVKPPPPAPAVTAAVPVVTTTTTAAAKLPSDVVYDLAGTPIKLVERAPGWGITYEFNKLAVGAASCGILKTASGDFIVLDAGVRLVGKGAVDVKLADAVLKRFAEVVVTSTGARAPFKLRLSHTHLDHTAMFERLSRDYVIEQVTLNTTQLRDPKFQEVLARAAANQLEVHRTMIKARIRETERAAWEKTDESKLETEAAAKERAFEKFLDERAHLELEAAKVEPLKLEVHVPVGTGAGTIKVELPGIEIVTRDVAAHVGSFVAKDAFGATVLDIAFGKQALEGPAETPSVLRDRLESNHILELPNGGKLVIVPDMRGGDIARNARALVAAVEKLGGGVTLLEIGHHFQKGFLKAGKRVAVDKASGLILGSELAQLSKVLTRIASKSQGAFAMTSGDIGKIDASVLKFLDLCGVTAVPTLRGMDTQFISAVTAKGEVIEGFRSGAAVDMKSGALLQRADLTLDKLREQLAEARDAEEREVKEINDEAARQRTELEAQRDSLQKQHELLDKAIKEKDYQGKKSAERRAERKKLKDRIEEVKREIKAVGEQAEQQIAEGPARAHRESIRDKHNEVANAKEALLAKVKKLVGKIEGPRALEPDALRKQLQQETETLEKIVDREFDALAKEGRFARITETSLVLLGRNVSRTAANAELIDAWRATYEARLAALAPDATITEQIEYVRQLQRLRDVITKQPDIADQKVVAHELEFIDEQIKGGTDALREQARTKGQTTTDIDPLTGATITKTVISEETALEAAERTKLVTTTDTPALTEEAKPGAIPAEAEPAAKPKATAYQKFDKGTRWLGDKVGRGLGALMIFQNIAAGAELIERYRNGEATMPEAGIGVVKSAYGINIGYRMLRGTHVSPVEFIIVSALEVGQALVADYGSTAERDTEITYALISAGLNTALLLVGSWLMTLGPFGMIAGFVVMALGETILNALGVKAWLAKMFDPRPNENIEVDRELQKMLEKYAFAIGAAELKGRKDPELQAFGARDPSAVRRDLDKELADRRGNLLRQEVEIVEAFDAAYKRAQKGFLGLKWLDDQRARFLSLFLKVHQNDQIPEGGQLYVVSRHWYSRLELKALMSKQTVLERLQATEGFVSLANATEDDVRGMEQWTKLDKRIGELTGLLYHDEINPENFEYVNWMKVFEAVSLLEQMIANARYRLEPDKQGTHRVAPLLPDGPAKKLYEQLVLQYENKLDVLRQRVLGMSMGTGMATGIKTEGKGFYVGKDVLGLPAIYYDRGTYYDPEYGDVTRSPTEASLLERLQLVVLEYGQLITEDRWEWSELPEGVTPATLKSDPDVIRTYRKKMLSDDAYKAYLFNLQAARAATLGVLERTHRLLDSSPTAKARLAEADKDYAEAERARIADYAHYFADELPELEERVAMAHVTATSASLGDTKEAPQMTGMEHVAAADEALLSHHLSTIRDRVIKAGVVMPVDPDQPIRRLFAIRERHDVIVGIKPGTEMKIHVSAIAAYATYEVFPINDAAIELFGDDHTRRIPLFRLVPVTLNNLKGVTAVGNTTLHPEPPALAVIKDLF